MRDEGGVSHLLSGPQAPQYTGGAHVEYAHKGEERSECREESVEVCRGNERRYIRYGSLRRR